MFVPRWNGEKIGRRWEGLHLLTKRYTQHEIRQALQALTLIAEMQTAMPERSLQIFKEQTKRIETLVRQGEEHYEEVGLIETFVHFVSNSLLRHSP